MNNQQELSSRIVAARRKCGQVAGRPAYGQRDEEIKQTCHQLELIESCAGATFVQFLEPVLVCYFMMTAGFAQARVGWEHPPENDRQAREKRYTIQGIRRDIRQIRASARRQRLLAVATELATTSHTTRNYLSNKLLIGQQGTDAIMQKTLTEIAEACSAVLESSLLQKAKRGPRVREIDDALIVSVVHLYEEVTGRKAGRASRQSTFARVLKHVFEIAGRPRGVQALRDRYRLLRPKSGPPQRQSRFGPMVLIARKVPVQRS